MQGSLQENYMYTSGGEMLTGKGSRKLDLVSRLRSQVLSFKFLGTLWTLGGLETLLGTSNFCSVEG